MSIMIVFIWCAVLVSVLVLYCRKTYSRFSKYGVKNEEVVPLFGNMLKVVLRKEHFNEVLNRLYKDFPEERFVGRFEFTKPSVVLRDLDLIKKITIKDFEYFLDHRGIVDETNEPLFARNLFSLKGQEWKDMRSTLSPAFTSSKIKLMVPFMEEVGDQMIATLKEKIKESATGFIELDCKDLTARYANDVIATCAFGLKVNSHTDVNNHFYKMGSTISNFKFRQMILFFAMAACPSINKVLKLTLFEKNFNDFFVDLVLKTMKDRKTRNIIRPDMIHLLMEARKGQLKHDKKSENGHDNAEFAAVEESSIGKKHTERVWSDVDLVAQAVLFFIAGFETISTAMSFALHELALHPEVQDRLVQEIKDEHAKHCGKMDFNSIQNMTYLDMVTSEVLRLWSPALALERTCKKDYNLGKPNSKATEDFIIKKGETVWVPTWGIHRDPNYFPNPEKFDPERFSDENKHQINTMAYMPFGLGPRNCIGSRFALCELKVLLYQVLLHLEVSPSKKTCLTGKISTKSFNPRLEGGHWLNFKIRN